MSATSFPVRLLSRLVGRLDDVRADCGHAEYGETSRMGVPTCRACEASEAHSSKSDEMRARFAAAQLADALNGVLVASGLDDDPDWKDDCEATYWFARKALWDYADARGDGWDPYCADDRDSPSASTAYEARLANLGKSLGWVTDDARASLRSLESALPDSSPVVPRGERHG